MPTATGTPVRLTWKLKESIPTFTSLTVAAGSGRPAGGLFGVAVLVQEARPPTTSCWLHLAGTAYHFWATGNQVPWPAPTPVRTSGVWVSGVTMEASWTS